MKNILPFALMLLTASCIKSYIPIPPPHPSSPGQTAPIGISAVLNGNYVTFNSQLSVDTSNGEVDILGWGDSVGYTNTQMAFVFSAYQTPLIKGLYTYQPNGTPYSSAMTVYFYGAYNTSNGFTNYDDSTFITNITDSSCTGTVGNATLHGLFMNPNYPYNEYDSTMTLSNMQFNVKW